MKRMKKLVTLGLSMLLAACIITGFAPQKALASADADRFKDPMTLTYVVANGEEYLDAAEVYAKVGEIVKEKTNTTLEFKFVSFDNYNTFISSGEKYDMIGVVSWLSFWDFVQSEAFAVIPDQMITDNAPWMAQQLDGYLKQDTLNGKRYGISEFATEHTSYSYVVRGDLMAKYGIEKVENWQDIIHYLDVIAASDESLIPFNLNSIYTLPSIYTQENGMMNIGGLNATAPMAYNIDANDGKLIDHMKLPEAVEFVARSQEWAAKGYWSKSALSNKVNLNSAFLEGVSALADCNLDQANMLAKQIEEAGNEWDLKVIPKAMNYALSSNGSGIAFYNGITEERMARALAVLDVLKGDVEVNKLMMNGIEGKHYEQIGPNLKLPLDDKGYGWQVIGVADTNNFMFAGGVIPGYSEIIEKIRANLKPDVLTDIAIDTSSIDVEGAALLDIFNEYIAPAFLGLVDGDPQAIIDDINARRAAAGVDKYIAEVQRQVDEFLAGN